jgi:hypothetical protein
VPIAKITPTSQKPIVDENGMPTRQLQLLLAALTEPGNITAADIADGAIITVKLANGSVSTDKLPDSVMTETKIADNSITTSKIVANAITSNLIAAGAILADQIYAKAITTEKINIGAVTTDTIGVNAVSRVAAQSSATGTASVSLTVVPQTSVCILGLFNGVLNTSASSATLNINVNGTNVDSVPIFADSSASPIAQYPSQPGFSLYASPYYNSGGFSSTTYSFVPWVFNGNRNLYPRSIQYNYFVPNNVSFISVDVVSSVTADVSVLVWGLQR